MGLRDRRQERRDEPGDSRFQMREKMFSIGDDYWIETGGGERCVQSRRQSATSS